MNSMLKWQKYSDCKEADDQLQHGVFQSCDMRCFHREDDHKGMKKSRSKSAEQPKCIDRGFP